MSNPLDDAGKNLLFLEARSHNEWLDKKIAPALVEELYALLKMAPTSANCCPARFVFLETSAAKERLKPCLAPGNVEKTMAAPLTVIIGYDQLFYEKLPALMPHVDARAWFTGNAALAESTAFRNSSLQGAYLMMAARSLGLDCGPLSGFDPAKVEEAFFSDNTLFPGSQIKTNFMCNLGYGDHTKVFPRNPRLNFSEACARL